MKFKTVSIIGLGYIGLPTAALIASLETKVIGVDTDEKKVAKINAKILPFIEPQLKPLIEKTIDNKFLRATTIVEPADVFIITVPTPIKKHKKEPDLTHIKAACLSISKVLRQNNLIILESTSPVGTTEKMIKWLKKQRPDLTFPLRNGNSADIKVAYCPERVLPGNILFELQNNSRIVGGITNDCSKLAHTFYKKFVNGKIFEADTRLAEMTKLVENSFRDVNIAFANELSIICDEMDVNIWELIQLANKHPRVDILKPGPGVGGHCIAIDPLFLASQVPKHSKLINTAREVNNKKPLWVIEQIKNSVNDYLKLNPGISEKDVVISCYGLSFKANIDDLRESPAVFIVKEIAEWHPGPISIIEPNISMLPLGFRENTFLVECNISKDTSPIKVILVDHKEFFVPIQHWLRGTFATIDTRGILNSA